jgi:signal transduction histidine kinase
MQQIRFTAYEMNGIINNLLLFAEVSRAEVPVEPVDMAKVVTNVRNRLGVMIKENRAKINVPRAWPRAFGYGPWLEEVWANYISNALKHGGQPPYIELGASAQPDRMIRFWTRDNGPGLPPKEQARLFTPFNQIGRLPNRGHGLGLSIALQIVEKLGGQVGVESELGKGSLFFFTLPASSSTS